MIIGFCLFVLGILTFFSVMLGASLQGSDVLTEPTTIQTDDGSILQILQSLNIAPETSGQAFYFSEIEGALVWLTVIIVIAGIIGIQVLGSGLSESSHRIIMIATIYGGVWSILSILTWDLIHSIPVYGTFLWLSLTVAYVIGVIKKMSEG